MRLLLIKTSSLGDVIHTLPALTDAAKHHPELQCDWVVEESFTEIPKMHPCVNSVIPISLRRWRKNYLKAITSCEIPAFIKQLRSEHYDYIIDAQGLIKSAIVTRLARGKHYYGLDKQSAREPLARFAYQQKIAVPRDLQAITRVRKLFAETFNYELPTNMPDYGLDKEKLQLSTSEDFSYPYLVFFHGTTWATKHWPVEYWIELANIAKQAGLFIKLPWGNATEKQRAEDIAKQCDYVEVLPKLHLTELATTIVNAAGVVAVDTGLGHLTAALDTPCISLYGPTNPGLSGSVGENFKYLQADFPCAPCMKRECHYQGAKPVEPACFSRLTPQKVWQNLEKIME